MLLDQTHQVMDIANSSQIEITSIKQVQSQIERTMTWTNWSGNLQYKPTAEDGQYYFLPTNESELKSIINQAMQSQSTIKLRVSGQRHSATPLIVNSNENNPQINTQHGSQWTVDLACYNDLGEQGNNDIVIDKANLTVTVNAGVTEDQLDAYLTANNLMLKTVTAGGFFSVGGMAAVDVHGATVDNSILADTIIAYTVMNDKGQKKTYDMNSRLFKGFKPLQFHRVSLGTLGIITSVTFKVQPRPYKNTLVPSQSYYSINDKDAFINTYENLLFSKRYQSVESFYNPYATYYNVLALRWSIDSNPNTPILNNPVPEKVETACEIAQKRQWGAPLLNPVAETLVQNTGQSIQNNGTELSGNTSISGAMAEIYDQMNTAIEANKAMWLTQSTRAAFMSYFIPLPKNRYHGLDVAWDALQIITNRLKEHHDFTMIIPPEFRFVRGSDALLAGVYSDDPDQLFISIEVLAMTKKTDTTNYPQNILNFFANIEYQWVKLGGIPHQGKLYGFFDPSTFDPQKDIKGVAPFNPNYIQTLNQRRGERLKVFAEYKKMLDPKGVFSNAYTDSITSG
ncbi:FAD-binding protein [Thiotrichales bacterium 19S3-7]|nr:FAD-binding protein [Thiotrichales bacterium 19S3-7]MCF6801091.1 FAD-binding protein [Thiotrichales bacterium 19S3-11]